jgi:hypothetical protein
MIYYSEKEMQEVKNYWLGKVMFCELMIVCALAVGFFIGLSI